MKLLRTLRQRLAWKLFLSYLIVILVGVIVLATTANAAIPTSFERHMGSMRSMMDGMTGAMNMEDDLFLNFRAAVNESLGLAATAALLVAVLVSLFISRRVVGPIQDMTSASRQIAAGKYRERVRIRRGATPEDLDELGQLAVSFNRMAAELERTEAQRRELIADVSHELRTPLTSIKGTMEGLLDGVLPAQPETFHQIYAEADRLQRLVNDLQELSRVEAGAYSLSLRPLRLPELAANVQSRLAQQFSEKGVRLEIDIPPDLPTFPADEDRLYQVLLNLVGNGLQYTSAGGEVRLSARRREEQIEIEVQDTGIGISPEHLPHLFTRFYRVDKSRSRAGGGSGIGLTVARHLVEAHGGRIWAESDGPGRGSAFILALPL